MKIGSSSGERERERMKKLDFVRIFGEYNNGKYDALAFRFFSSYFSFIRLALFYRQFIRSIETEMPYTK